MAINNFKPFAVGAGANVMTQADFEALAALLTGFQSGTAQSQQLNKVWRQSSIMAAVLAQFIVDLTGQDAIDDGTTATLLANLKAAAGASSVGVVGSMRNGRMSVAAASSTATFTADEIIVESALGGLTYRLANFNESINLATTGAGGMDTGTAPASGYVALYAIYSPVKAAQHASDPITYPDDGRALLATNATSAIAPNVYAGANMPSGYTASALVSVWPTNASGQFVAAFQRDRQIAWLGTTVLSTTSQVSTPTSLNVSAAIPLNAKFCSGYLDVSVSTTSTSIVSGALHGNSLGYGGAFAYFNTGSSTAGGGQRSSFSKLLVANPQTLYYTITASAGAPGFSVYVNNYEF
ncbi:hypothetical protein [Burkholderia multivorans]|uniref:hypothetical protein n=1 Tax=Burkholderia multivorans TaxID=87883 RepID=UPI0020194857|nr:hypothetical protein [Burkholderia multivorans]MCO1382563.1 hypothetical protein [Burkholderia multivorans]MCO1402697.1 hypothetical protein [Burkholderia multivorans]UQO78770.1 hypothetical protein L0Z12_07050 [Burkholderia multivorans]